MSTDTLAGSPPAEDTTPATAAAPEAAVVVSAPPAATPPAGTPPVVPPAADAVTPPAAAPGAPVTPPAADPAKPAAASWPDDWRQKIAGENAEELKKLEKFDSPLAMAAALKAAEEKAAGVKPTLPKDATPEQLAAFRKEAGIPEKPEAYEIKPSNGYVFGEIDKPALDSFKSFAHANNWTPDQVQQGGEWYAQMQEEVAGQQAESDSTFKAESEDSLRQVWGADFRRNIGAVQNFLATAPDGMADRLLGGRSSDGRRLGDDPALLQWLARTSREINPMATVVPAGTSNPVKAVDEELAGMRAMMGDPHSAYNKGPQAQAMQARYRELITAKTKVAAR
ncbi:hypothetical protein [uncultured Methylobacterium sp.]|uniref:hypothetical protein n=1 Tax=uncultured Methylobacterium sp. TaxID=157278 RepID=UPI0035CB7EC6